MANFFVNRPIVGMVISIMIVLMGLVAMQRLPITQYPEITPPEVVVEGTYTGASAVDVELSAEEIAAVEAPYRAHPVKGLGPAGSPLRLRPTRRSGPAGSA